MTLRAIFTDVWTRPVKVTITLLTMVILLIGLYIAYSDNLDVVHQTSLLTYIASQPETVAPQPETQVSQPQPSDNGYTSKTTTTDVIIQRGLVGRSPALQLLTSKRNEIQEARTNKTEEEKSGVAKLDWINSYSKLESHVSKVNTTTQCTLRLDPLPYLENFRNPCWIERLPEGVSNPYNQRAHKFEMMGFNQQHLQVKSQFNKRKEIGKPYRMRCLPYYYIIGPQKSGTTDLYKSLVQHPGVIPSMAKEPHWWARSRIAKTTLEEYIDLYDQAAETIARHAVVHNSGSTFHPYVTGDATPELIWDNWEWKNQKENIANGVLELTYITADHIRHVTPQARIIAMLRDPISRLWSDYNYFGHGWTRSAEDYHTRVQQGLSWVKKCSNKIKTDMDRRHCMYNSVPEYGGKYGGAWNPVGRVRMGMYSEFLVDWFNIFPRDQILILKMEDYAKDRISVLNQIVKFLGLEEFPEELAVSLRSTGVKNAVSHAQYARTGHVKDETRHMLKEFYKPYNEKLADLTGNSDFLKWNL